MNRCELTPVRSDELDRIVLMKLEWIMRLRLDIYADYLETS
jgi:hypothetical protein